MDEKHPRTKDEYLGEEIADQVRMNSSFKPVVRCVHTRWRLTHSRNASGSIESFETNVMSL